MEGSTQGASDSKTPKLLVFGVPLVLALVHAAFALTVVPRFDSLYSDLEDVLPMPTRAIIAPGALGLAIILLIVDATIFLTVYRRARNSQTVLFAVPLAFVGILSLLILVLYMPMRNTINLIR